MKRLNLKYLFQEFIRWAVADPYALRKKEEFEIVLKEYEENFESIKKKYPLSMANGLVQTRQIALALENIYTQRKIVEATGSLRAATWVLVGATLLMVIGNNYGSEGLSYAYNVIFEVLLVIFAFILGIASVRFMGRMIYLFLKKTEK